MDLIHLYPMSSQRSNTGTWFNTILNMYNVHRVKMEKTWNFLAFEAIITASLKHDGCATDKLCVQQHLNYIIQIFFKALHICQRQSLSKFFLKIHRVSKVRFMRFYYLKTEFIRILLIKPHKSNFWYPMYFELKLR